MTFSERLTKKRKEMKLTQGDIAEQLGVSIQAVSLWERGSTIPDTEKVMEIAFLLDVSIDWLLTGKVEESVSKEFKEDLEDRLFDENRMYTYVKTYAGMNGMFQTIKVLPYARELHKGQFRSGKDHVPYIYHPLTMACHALALGLDDDNLISAILLHDICEDCNVEIDELPVNEETRAVVALVTKGKDYCISSYYQDILGNAQATMVKLIDRCNNVSGMAAGFSKKKLTSYINETEKYIYPLIQKAKIEYPMYSNQLFLIKYHISSVLEAIKHQG